MTAGNEDFPKTPRCWKCSHWGSDVVPYRLHPAAQKWRWKCADTKACDDRIAHDLMRARLGI